MVALSTASSTRARTASAKAVPPHMLGGSKSLMAERHRREQLETELEHAQQRLQSVKTALAPQVEELKQTVEAMQLEKRHQLDLDETSQLVLEGLQQQIHELFAANASLSAAMDDRLSVLQDQLRDDLRAEKYALQLVVSQLQDAQDELAAEVRLLQHEVSASKQYLDQRIAVTDDAVQGLRVDLASRSDRHELSHRGVHARVSELDEKLFLLDKELLKIKLLVPSVSSAGGTSGPSGSATGTAQKLHELSTDVDALKAELTTYRGADRQQFDALTTRLREAAKSHQTLRRDHETRFQELEASMQQLVTRVPSELAKRLLHAQSQWRDELETLRGCVQRLEATPRRALEGSPDTVGSVYDADTQRGMDTAIRRHGERLDQLQSDLETSRAELAVATDSQTAATQALAAGLRRIERDVLGLYDWVRAQVRDLEEVVAFNDRVLRHFQTHAKILPKSS
ncbi:hypothetical protein ATCC90586_011277 [Pythium insidiosum]|nr:hypothetical protein ATCC90586_011277 [Pythium insidiosum]